MYFASYKLCPPPGIISVYPMCEVHLLVCGWLALKVQLLHFPLFFYRELWVLKMPPFTKRGFLLDCTQYRVIDGI